MQKLYILFIVPIVLAVLAFFGYMYYMRFYVPPQNKTYQADARVAYDTFVSGDYVTSVESLPALIAQAPNKSEFGRLKILLGVSYWFRDQSGDRTQAIKTLKEVVNDYSIPAVWRAQALNSIARFVNDSSLSFYQIHFSEAPYNAFVPAEGTDAQKVSAVYLALLKYSDDTYPTSWAEYAIAHHYAALSSIGDGDKMELARLMIEYIQAGDSRKDQSIYSPSILMQGLYFRALATGRSSILLGSKQESVKDAEDAYKLVFDTANRLDQNQTIIQLLLRTRFFNANFLSYQSGRESDIEILLKPFSSVDPSTSGATFTTLKDSKDTNFNKIAAIKLAKISPDFKIFLNKIGVLVE